MQRSCLRSIATKLTGSCICKRMQLFFVRILFMRYGIAFRVQASSLPSPLTAVLLACSFPQESHPFFKKRNFAFYEIILVRPVFCFFTLLECESYFLQNRLAFRRVSAEPLAYDSDCLNPLPYPAGVHLFCRK